MRPWELLLNTTILASPLQRPLTLLPTIKRHHIRAMAIPQMSASPHSRDTSSLINNKVTVVLKVLLRVTTMASSNNISSKVTRNRATAIHNKDTSSREDRNMEISKGSM